jgi:beta-glucanase (GH16 family)
MNFKSIFTVSFTILAVLLISGRSNSLTSVSSSLADFSYPENHWKDNFDNLNAELWRVYENFTWENNNSYMQSDNVEFKKGILGISMIKGNLKPDFFRGRSNSCGSLFTVPFKDNSGYDFKYGKYVVRMKAATGSGVVSSFFLFRWDPWQEVDVEFLGKDTTKIHLNVFFNEEGNNANEDPIILPLGYDAAADFHTYAIEWEKDHISWYVDGKCVWTKTTPAGKIPYKGMYLAMNVWNCTSSDWVGPLFTDEPKKRTAYYDWVEYFPSGSY